MYSRKIEGKEYTFEASGGLLNASLVMQDKETDSYWSIMTKEALYGQAKGEKLEQLPGSNKMTWGEWQQRNPDTLVLSHRGREHVADDPYISYFTSPQGFGGTRSSDTRMPDKSMIYSFHWAEEAYAVPHHTFNGGGVVYLKGQQLFLYREKRDSFYKSTTIFLAPDGAKYKKQDDRWILVLKDQTTFIWDKNTRSFGTEAMATFEAFQGFDTYWYIWSLTNKGTKLAMARRN